MPNQQGALPDIAALEVAAMRAAQAGRDDEATRLWGRILAIDPNHLRTLTALGQRAFRQGDKESARTAFQRIVDLDGSDAQQWIHLALACRNLNDDEAEGDAIHRALSLDPTELVALILRANLLERQGKTHEAARAYGSVAAVAPPIERLRPELQPAVSQALAHAENYHRDMGAFLDRYLDPYRKGFAGENLKRFSDSVDIMVGRKKRYDSQSVVYHYPGLAAVEFFDRAEFPWLDAFEAATGEIRDEFLAVLVADGGPGPAVARPEDAPQSEFAELRDSPHSNDVHLYRMGKPFEENAARCPVTMKLLEGAPQPDQPGRTPTAMFSLLGARTRMPPQAGASNVRLVTHVPLIIPAGCGFRVGNDTRQWVAGQAWVYDDTIEHEAWNDSDRLRVVLMFDIWNPQLTPPEREMIAALASGLNAFTGGAGAPVADA